LPGIGLFATLAQLRRFYPTIFCWCTLALMPPCADYRFGRFTKIWYYYQNCRYPSMATAIPRTDVRTHILDTALSLLGAHGVAYLTQPRVSKAAGVRQSHLTYYFPTRGDLMIAVARHSMDMIARPLLAQAQEGALTAAQVPGVLSEALTDRRRMRIMLGLIAAADEDPQVREALREIVRLLRTRFSLLFGMLGLPGDPQSVALVHTFVVGAAVLYHARADETARREAQAAVRFITGLIPHLSETAQPNANVRAAKRRSLMRKDHDRKDPQP
jgi:AcrR family transcriptional regulator